MGQNAMFEERAIGLSKVKKKEGMTLTVVSNLFPKPLPRIFIVQGRMKLYVIRFPIAYK